MTAVQYPIHGGDFEHGGSASRAVKEELKRLGADPAVVRRAMIAAYEAEMNVVIHSQGGELRASLDNGQLDVDVIDSGPGIEDVARAMKEGYSTASAQARELGFGAGMGLPNIKRNADTFAIESEVGRGTRVHFTIRLRPQALYGSGRHSIRIAPEKCRQSLRCVGACPTQAIRVFRGKPEILDYLCVDCTACIAACPTGALAINGSAQTTTSTIRRLLSSVDVLVVPPPALVQFGARVAPAQVVQELSGRGAANGAEPGPCVRLLAEWEAALAQAVSTFAEQDAPAHPVISPACPAVVNLIETKFPSLLAHVAPFASPIEAAQVAFRGDSATPGSAGRGAAFLVSCPAQRTALAAGAEGSARPPHILAPDGLRSALAARLTSEKLHQSAPAERESKTTEPEAEARAATEPDTAVRQAHETASSGISSVAPSAMSSRPALRVTGLRHVLDVLNAIEDGLATDIDIVEPWVCDEGCWGSPLYAEDPFLAQRRWQQAPDGATSSEAAPPASGLAAVPATAVRRSRPLAPRPGLRLDSDMAKAIQKLGRIDKLRRTLPGSDCGMCGAPSCAALAEDIVLGRAAADACVRQRPSG